MALKCCDCGHIFDECERKTWEELHGEMLSGCPLCCGGYEETKKCKICGGEFLEDELNGGCVCDECIEEYRKDFDTCYKISKLANKEEVKINAFFASLFSEEEIETILYHYLKTKKEVNCLNFVEQDKHWFAEKLAEEVSK